MAISASDKFDLLADEILATWKEFTGADITKKWGESCQELLRMATDFCGERDWEKAQECCEVVSEILGGDWDRRGRMDMDTELAGGAVEFYLATTFVGQDNFPTALIHYKESSEKFSAKFMWVPVAVIWFNVGRIYSFKQQWPKAIWAYQRSLNALDNLLSRTSQVEKLEGMVNIEFNSAKKGLDAHFRAPIRVVKDIEPDQKEKDLGIRKLYIVHKIAAGPAHAPIEAIVQANIADDNVIDTVTLDAGHLKGAHIGLEVEGESMIEAGILNGDYAFIRLGENADNGTIVVASICPDGEEPENTLKKYYREDEKFSQYPHHRLQPMNSSMSQIIIAPRGTDLKAIETRYRNRGIPVTTKTGDLQIIGKLVAIWRKV